MPFCGVGAKTVQRKLVLLGDGACGTDHMLESAVEGLWTDNSFE